MQFTLSSVPIDPAGTLPGLTSDANASSSGAPSPDMPANAFAQLFAGLTTQSVPATPPSPVTGASTAPTIPAFGYVDIHAPCASPLDAAPIAELEVDAPISVPGGLLLAQPTVQTAGGAVAAPGLAPVSSPPQQRIQTGRAAGVLVKTTKGDNSVGILAPNKIGAQLAKPQTPGGRQPSIIDDAESQNTDDPTPTVQSNVSVAVPAAMSDIAMAVGLSSVATPIDNSAADSRSQLEPLTGAVDPAAPEATTSRGYVGSIAGGPANNRGATVARWNQNAPADARDAFDRAAPGVPDLVQPNMNKTNSGVVRTLETAGPGAMLSPSELLTGPRSSTAANGQLPQGMAQTDNSTPAIRLPEAPAFCATNVDTPPAADAKIQSIHALEQFVENPGAAAADVQSQAAQLAPAVAVDGQLANRRAANGPMGGRSVEEQRGAKIAVNATEASPLMATAQKAFAKSFVIAEGKYVTPKAGEIGTDVADPTVTMASGSTFARSTSAASTEAVMAATRSETPAAPVPANLQLTNTAQRAVEAVLNVTDRFASRDHHSVNLQFSVGGADLNVRVELRADEVRTTFRTDSPELRAALSHEWQAVATPSTGADRSLRLASPVFTSSDASSLGNSAGDAASRQRDQGGRSGAEENKSFMPVSRDSSSIGTTDPTPVAARARSITSLHLHTLA
jgi:hypothetical protein